MNLIELNAAIELRSSDDPQHNLSRQSQRTISYLICAG